MAHRTIHKHFNEWVTQVYGGKGLTKEQREEMRKAFYSGAFILMNINRELGEMEDKENAVKQLTVYNEELLAEITKWLAQGEYYERMFSRKSRRCHRHSNTFTR